MKQADPYRTPGVQVKIPETRTWLNRYFYFVVFGLLATLFSPVVWLAIVDDAKREARPCRDTTAVENDDCRFTRDGKPAQLIIHDHVAICACLDSGLLVSQ